MAAFFAPAIRSVTGVVADSFARTNGRRRYGGSRNQTYSNKCPVSTCSTAIVRPRILMPKSRMQPPVASFGDCQSENPVQHRIDLGREERLVHDRCRAKSDASRSRSALCSLEIITTFACGLACIRRTSVAWPSRPGILTSRKTTSNVSELQRASASTPVLSDIFAAKPFADLDAKWTINEQAAANFMRVIFPA